ncbi:glycosyltransferase family 4 protein [Syntrophomonas erecta]
MPAYINGIALVSAFVVALVSMPLVIKLAFRLGAIDRPNQRKVHAKPMPRMGGMAIFLAFILVMTCVVRVSGPFLGMIYGAIIIFVVGLLDDIWQLSAWVKLVGQIIAAVVAIYFGVVVQFMTNPFDGFIDLGLLSIPVTMLWIVGVTNAVNLIDGLDGLAAGVSGIAAISLGIVALLQGQSAVALAAFVLVAAILGFLPYNFYPARTFMGDSGSNLLGFLLACLAILGTAKSAALISLFIPIVILGIPIFDTFFAIIRRIHNKAPIFRPDKDHLHHRLMAMGMSHRRSVFIIYGISAFFSAVAVALTFITSPKATLVLAILLLIVILGARKIGMVSGDHTVNPQMAKPVKTRNVEL